MRILVYVGIIFPVVVVVLAANALRRSSAMSDELSTAWEKGFETIKLAAMIEKEQKVSPTPQPSSKVDNRSRELAGYSTLQTELQENRGRLREIFQGIAARKENGTRMRNEILSLRTQISSLQERLLASQEEARKLKTRIEASAKRQEIQVQEPAPQPAPEPEGLVEQPKGETWTSSHLSNIFNRRTCSTCGRDVESSDMYCDSCGQPLPRTA